MDCFEHDFADLDFAYKELWPSSCLRNGFALSPQVPRRVPSPTLFAPQTPLGGGGGRREKGEEHKENIHSNNFVGLRTRPQRQCSALPGSNGGGGGGEKKTEKDQPKRASSAAETQQVSIQRQAEHWMALATMEANVAKPNDLARLEKRRKSIQIGKSVIKGVETFSCTQCPPSNKLYRSREGLVLHIRSAHENDRPWCCPLAHCRAAYVRKGDLRGHVVSQHCQHTLCLEQDSKLSSSFSKLE
ncbi:hypothetical protein BASA81_007728 [Batrachochytrium salamandrivorans]|nr:hypothetical protein BASA81_007728 [Batrachochytrium salamandrivorans]